MQASVRTALADELEHYLGLADHPEVRAAAMEALERWGFGVASVRFICGTQTIHRQLEERLSQFLGTEATILYGSCFDANAGLFETLLDAEDAVISDALNHASTIDGIRLCKAGCATPTFPRRRIRGGHRPGHAGAARGQRPRGHPDRHAGQGARGRQRRLRQRPPRGRRPPAAAVAPVPLLQPHRAAGRGRVAARAGPVGDAGRAARIPAATVLASAHAAAAQA